MELRILLISSVEDFNRQLKLRLSEAASELGEENLKVKVYEKIPSMEEAVVHFAPHLIVIHFEEALHEEKTHFLDQLSRVSERIPVVVSAPLLESEFMLHCVKKGVRDFLKQPISREEVVPMLTRLLHETPKSDEDKQLAETYTFFSYKGGIGTTFLSCNTAVSMAELSHKRVLLWDLVFQNGDVPFFFDYDPVATLTDLLENLSRIDSQYLTGVLPEQSCGISILPAPKRPEEAENIRADQIAQLHQLLRKFYDYIIVDAGHSLTDPVISLMDHSKYILVTTDLHLPVLKNTLRCLEVFERLGYVEGKFKLLLNRYNSKYEKFDLEKAEEILRYPIAYHFSNDYVTASRSLNAGIPVNELDAKSELADQFRNIASLMNNDFIKPEPKPKLMEKIFGGKSDKKNRRKKDQRKVKPEEGEENAA